MSDLVPISDMEDLVCGPNLDHYEKVANDKYRAPGDLPGAKFIANSNLANLRYLVEVMKENGIVFARQGDRAYDHTVSDRYRID